MFSCEAFALDGRARGALLQGVGYLMKNPAPCGAGFSFHAGADYLPAVEAAAGAVASAAFL